jgi:hypothetical protein
MRRFPSPWRAEKIAGGFIVRDATGRAVARVYGQDSPIEVVGVPRALTLDEARQMALSIARLPEVSMDREVGLQAAPLGATLAA